MNRYPLWKYATLLVVLLLATLYTLPNFFGESPAVQVSSAKATVKVEASLVTRVEQVLAQQGVPVEAIQYDGHSVKARFASPDQQLKARDALDHALNLDAADPSHIVALNLLPRTPAWLQALHASPMYLGLDLRGGVHFMLQVDMAGALSKRAEGLAGEVRLALREKDLKAVVRREGQTLEIRMRDAQTRDQGAELLSGLFRDWAFQASSIEGDYHLKASLKPAGAFAIQQQALKQNINTVTTLGPEGPSFSQPLLGSRLTASPQPVSCPARGQIPHA